MPNSFPNDVLYRHGDLNDITFDEIDSFKPEFFIHLAATFERTKESKDFWDLNFTHNVKLSHHLMYGLGYNQGRDVTDSIDDNNLPKGNTES